MFSGKTIRGGEIVARILAAERVDTVFGIIDGTYFGLIAGFEPNDIRLVTPRHEASALHMAGAYARATGRLGVAIASNGPGVANALSGVAVENAEGNRVLLITSCRRVGIAYPDRGGAYQYFPQTEVTAPMTKWSVHVPSVDRLAEIMRQALRVAFTGRPGVVHVDVPESVMNADVEPVAAWFREPAQYRALEPLAAPVDQVARAAELLRGARRPTIHAGSGVAHAMADVELERVASLLEAPITTSWGARCVMDERIPQAVPMCYVDAVNAARADADVVLVLGSRLGETDWWGKAPYWGLPDEQAVIQVDLDPGILGANRPTELAIQADVGAFLRQLADALAARPVPAERLRARAARVASLGEMKAARRAELDAHLKDVAVPMHPAHVPHVAREVFEDDAILVIDGGNTAIWANFYHEVRVPHTVLGTAKMGMLGAGVGQALGAKAAFPDRQVYCIIGDGAMGFHQQEVETAVRSGLPVVYIVLCDRQWGMVKINQSFMLKPVKTLVMKSLDPSETINTELSETRFDELARAMGAYGERVADPAGLRGALERAVASGRPAVVHVDVDRTKHMWAPNLKTFKDMHAEPAGKK
ncbi:MAG: thiamine pyrophosphate-binding protein [Deltaproteobacteria bacterium]|nr:thiamine pyrophosphate-binding protein [Deltaproteobacteria bacterium]